MTTVPVLCDTPALAGASFLPAHDSTEKYDDC